MNIDIRITIPGGIQSARVNRVALRAALVTALSSVVQDERETRGGRIVNPNDEQIGDLTCTIAHPGAKRAPYGVLHPTNTERAGASRAFGN